MDTLLAIILVGVCFIAACTGGIVTKTVSIVERRAPMGRVKCRETVWIVLFLPIYVYRRPY